MFFLRQFFEGLPKELEEAAMIDGANQLQVFYKVVLSSVAARAGYPGGYHFPG